MRILISSTFSDLQQHRNYVRKTISNLQNEEREEYLKDVEVYEYVDIPALTQTDSPSLNTILEYVKNSDIFLLLVGWRYGYIPEGNKKSILELEYETATNSGIIIYTYIIDEDYPIPAKYIETGLNAKKLQNFKQKLLKDKIVKTFTTPENLAFEVASDLTRFYRTTFSEAVEDGYVRSSLEKETVKLKNKVFLYEETINVLRKKIDNIVPALPIWNTRNFVIDTTLAFVLMPFRDDFFSVYEEGILPAIENAGLRGRHAGDIFDNREIVEDIWESICISKIIIADVTNKNPNVFYELGICHTIGKEVIIITQNNEDVPFEIKHRRYILYRKDKMTTLKLALEKTIKNIILRLSDD